MRLDAAAYPQRAAGLRRDVDAAVLDRQRMAADEKSAVRLTAMTPAMIAVSNTGPLRVRWPVARKRARHGRRQLCLGLGDTVGGALGADIDTMVGRRRARPGA
ncbi:MAG: hypothetical protein U1F67_23335 [Rubrivivax sp.]